MYTVLRDINHEKRASRSSQLALLLFSVAYLVLTADVDGVVEGIGNLGVHFDEQLLLDRQVLIALRNLLAHPLAEAVAHDRIDDVDEPGSRRLVQTGTSFWHCFTERPASPRLTATSMRSMSLS